MLTSPPPPDLGSARIWHTKLPAKIMFFWCLLYHRRLNSRANLFHKNIRRLEESYCEFCLGVMETDDHISSHCVPVHWPPGLPWGSRYPLAATLHPGSSVAICPFPTRLARTRPWCYCGTSGKPRNAKVFDQCSVSTSEVIRRAAADLAVWSSRYKGATPPHSGMAGPPFRP